MTDNTEHSNNEHHDGGNVATVNGDSAQHSTAATTAKGQSFKSQAPTSGNAAKLDALRANAEARVTAARAEYDQENANYRTSVAAIKAEERKVEAAKAKLEDLNHEHDVIKVLLAAATKELKNAEDNAKTVALDTARAPRKPGSK